MCPLSLCIVASQNPHVSTTSGGSSSAGGPGGSTIASAGVICRYHPYCSKPACPFLHPKAYPCRYGQDCKRPDCIFQHPLGGAFSAASDPAKAPCRFGVFCSRPYCPFQHPEGHRKPGGLPANFGGTSRLPFSSPTGLDLPPASENLAPLPPPALAAPETVSREDSVDRVQATSMSLAPHSFMDEEDSFPSSPILM
jgi:hypothetical protein